MSECNLEAWTTVTMLSQNLYEVKFPNGELIPISHKMRGTIEFITNDERQIIYGAQNHFIG